MTRLYIMRTVTDRLSFYCKITIIVSCQLTLINSALSDERDAITILSRRTYRSNRAAFLYQFSAALILLRYYAQRESSDKSFVEKRSRILRSWCVDASDGEYSSTPCIWLGAFLPAWATTTVNTLPPVNQGFYSVNCRALTSVSH